MKHAYRQERSTRLKTQPRSGHCLVEGFEWPWRGSLITRREGEEIVGVCYKVEVGTHTKIGNEKRAPGMPEIKETGKRYNKDTQTRTRIRVTRRDRGCARKRKRIESKKAQVRWLHHLVSKCLNYDKADV
jgi:hypothetical protein